MKFDIINNTLKNKKEINAKILHISDIHFSSKYNLNILKDLLKIIGKQKPTYICITGDLIDNMDISYKDKIEYFYKFIEDLGKITTTIISLGNHEFYTKKNNTINKYIANIKKIKNVILLDNNNYKIDNINFIGYTEDICTYKSKKNNKVIKDISKLLKNINEKNYNILLSHNPSNIIDKPNFFEIKNIKSLDLILSGHTHGGLLSAKKKGNFGIISANKKLFPKNVRGHLKKGNTDIIITTGITKLSHNTIFYPLNFLFTPAVDIITIEK